MWKFYEVQISAPRNKILLEHSHAHLYIVYGCFCKTLAGLNSCDRDCMVNDACIYLFGPIQKKFADSCFILLLWDITLIDFQILNHTCISGINPTWLWSKILLYIAGFSLLQFFLGIFASLFLRDMDQISFCYDVVVCQLRFQKNTGLTEWVMK